MTIDFNTFSIKAFLSNVTCYLPMNTQLFPLFAGGIGVVYALFLIRKIMRLPHQSEGKMADIAKAIDKGLIASAI